MDNPSPTRAFLSHLHRGGSYAYWWTAEGRQSFWWQVGKPEPLPGGRRNVYFGIHPTIQIPATNRRGEPADPAAVRSQIGVIAAVNCLFAEFDAKDFGGSLDATIDHVNSLDPAPSVVIASGGGYHCYWLLNDSWLLTTDAERRRAADVQARWVARVGSDDGAKDLARVLRVPGTHNYKYDPAPTVAYERCNLDVIYDRDALIALLPDGPAPMEREVSGPAPSRVPEWAAKKLATAISMATLAADGAKHTTLLKAATLAGGCVPHLTEREIETALYSAIVGRAKDAKGALDTIRDGIAWGASHPLAPPADVPALAWRSGAAYCPTCGEQARPSKYHDGLYCGNHKPAYNWRNDEARMPSSVVAPEYIVAEPVETWIDKGVTLAELQHKHFEPLQWIVEDILPEGVCLVAAKPKAKKSWLALGVGVAVAMGTAALGRLKTIRGDVLFLDLEGNQRRIKSRTRAMLGTLATAWPDNFHVYTEWKKGAECLAMLEQWMTVKPNTKCVVIDLLAEIRPPMDPKANPYDYDRALLVELNRFAERHHISIIVIHHTRKAKGEDVFDEVSGTLGINGAVSTMWIISKSPEGHVILNMTGRDLQKDEPLALTWDSYLCNFVIDGTAAEVAVSEERRAILSLLMDDQAWTPKQIAADLGKSVGSIQQLLRDMLQDGTIDKAGYGKYARVPGKSDQTDKSGKSGKSGNSYRDVPTLTDSYQGVVRVSSASQSPKTAKNDNSYHSYRDSLESDDPAATIAALRAQIEAARRAAARRAAGGGGDG